MGNSSRPETIGLPQNISLSPVSTEVSPGEMFDTARSLGTELKVSGLIHYARHHKNRYLHPLRTGVITRVDEVAAAIVERRTWVRDEQAIGALLVDALTSGEDDERGNAEFNWAKHTVDHPMLCPVVATVQTPTGPQAKDIGERFNLGLARGRDKGPDILADKQVFWGKFGVESAEAAKEFMQSYFRTKRLDVRDPESWPAEVAFLCQRIPGLNAVMREIVADGGKIEFRRLTETPPVVLESVKNISTTTQHRFISTWAGPYIQDGRPPVIRPDDYERVAAEHEREQKSAAKAKRVRAGRLHWRRHDDETREYALEEVDSKFRHMSDLQGDLDRITQLKSLALTLRASAKDGSVLTEERQLAMQMANQLLERELAPGFTAKRIVPDTANSSAEGLAKIIKLLTVFAPIAYGLEHVPWKWLSDAAKAAGSFDDLAAEGGEVGNLKNRGSGWRELASRLGVIPVVAASAVALGWRTNEIAEHYGWHAAGLTYGTSTVLTSAVTTVLSLRTYANYYRDSVRDGRIGEPQMATMATDDEADIAAAVQEVIPAMVEELEHASADVGVAEIDEAVTEADEAVQEELVAKKPKIVVSRRDAYGAAARELILNTYARLGIVVGAAASPTIGYASGEKLFHNDLGPFVYVPFGALETLLGVAAIHGMDFVGRKLWARRVRKMGAAALQSTE